MSLSHQRQLDQIADDLLADDRFAALVALFNDQPPSRLRARRSAARGRRRVLDHPLLAMLTVLVAAAFIASVVAVGITRNPTFLVGTVLMVPAFVLFGLCCQQTTMTRVPDSQP